MSSIINPQRRQFLQYSFFGVAAASLPGISAAAMKQIKSEPSPDFHPDVEIEFTSRNAFMPILSNGEKSKVQKYYGKLLKGPENTLQDLGDNFLGPVMNLVKGQKVRVYYKNRLNEPSIIHWHGLHVPQASDGHPMYTIGPGEQYVYEFEVMNPAGTSFYHSHAHEVTGDQVYFGLAGLIQVTDEAEKALGLPSGEYDVPLVLQDRRFDAKNQLRYVRGMHDKMMGFLGDKIIVNGKEDAEFSVKTRAYRFRALNGSNSRIYKLGWDDGTPLTAIGTDAHLLEKPETRPYIMLAPGERVDLWLDFSGREVGSKLVLYSLSYTGAMPPMYERMRGMQSDHGGMDDDPANETRGMGMGMGMMGGGMMSGGLAQGAKFAVATFNVTAAAEDSPKLPTKLVAFDRLTEASVDNAAKPIPIGISEKPMRPQLNGKSFTLDHVFDFEKVKLGSIKKIKIFHDHGPGGGQHGDAKMDHGAKPKDDSAMQMEHGADKQDDESMQDGHGRGGMGKMGGMRHGGGMDMMSGMQHDGDAQQANHEGGMGMGRGMRDRSGMRGMRHGGDTDMQMGGGMQEGDGMGMMGGMNLSMAHPIHLHGQQYQVLSRKIGPMGSKGYETVKDGFIDSGWKDTVLVMPGEEVEIAKPFQDFKGLFLYHCHNLEHENLGMMRQFLVE
ncbi:multicopper oxidase family protein [Methylotuvimicrobium sp.]|uniref:multicopper oxidase family protein n=1 Tax=Methylotuvimicrobium sp. TaxID=2822413 RepID=UPI003D645BB3